MRSTKTTLAAPIAGLVLATSASFGAPVETNDNAALRYWRAFSLLSEADSETIKTLHDAQQARGDTWLDNQEHAEWLASKGETIGLLIDASEMPEADFGIDYAKGIDALLTHLSPMRASARLLLLRARADLRAGEPDLAVERVAAAMRMAEHITDDRVIISSLVSATTFKAAGDLILEAHESGALDGADLTPVRGAMDRFDRRDPFAVLESVRSERDIFGGWLHRTLADLPENGRAGTVLDMLSLSATKMDEEGRRAIATIETNKGLDSQMASLRLYFKQAIDAWHEPDAPDRLRMLEQSVSEGVFGNVAIFMAPSLTRAHEHDTRARAGFDELLRIVSE